MKRYKPLFEKEEVLPEIYPKMSLPLKDSDLSYLYDMFNKEYFSNELPKLNKIYFSPLAKNVYGRYTHAYNKDTTKLRNIMIIGNVRTSIKEVCDTMLHEMIHVWQFYMAEKTGEREYKDEPFFSFLLEKDERGHMEYFKQWMDKFNHIGFNIAISSDLAVDVDLIAPAYAFVGHSETSKTAYLFSYIDFKDMIPDVINQLNEYVGEGFITGYSYYVSKDFAVTGLPRLTKQGKLPKNIKNFLFSDTAEKYFMNSKLTQPIISQNKMEIAVDDNRLSPILIQTVSQLNKWREGEFGGRDDIYGYFGNIVRVWYEDEFKDNFGKLKPSEIREKLKTVPENAYNYLYKFWTEIPDVEIKRSGGMDSVVLYLESAMMDMMRDAKKQAPIDILTGEPEFKSKVDKEKVLNPTFKMNSTELDNINYNYNKKFKDRVNTKRFRKLVHESYWAKIKRKAKKYVGYEDSLKSPEFIKLQDMWIDYLLDQSVIK